jgi:hypothetical protein
MKENDKFILLAGIAHLLAASVFFYSIIMTLIYNQYPSIFIVQTIFLFFFIITSGTSYCNLMDFLHKDYESIEDTVSKISTSGKGYVSIQLLKRKTLWNPSVLFRPYYFDIEENTSYKFVYGSRGKVIVDVKKIDSEIKRDIS